MATGPTKTVNGETNGLVTLVRAALPAVPGLNRLPGIKKSAAEGFAGLTYARTGVAVERAQVDRYAAVCGFPRKDVAPITYPHMLAFGLHMAIMSDPAFPYPAMGMVHLENAITRRRHVRVDDLLDVTVSVGAPRAHEKGALLDFVTTVSDAADDSPLWESTSTYLRRGRPPEGTPEPGFSLPTLPSGGVRWRLPADLGRRYAAVSGDHNPIHLYPLTAKALGFPRQIAHGMWTKARCLAAIENRLPEQVAVEVAFKKPVFLPGTVTFAAQQEGEGWTFALTNPKDGAPHLVGRTS